MIYFGNSPKEGNTIFRVNCILKNLALTMFLFHRYIFYLLEKRLKMGVTERELKIPQPPYIMKIIQYKRFEVYFLSYYL